eukprot:Selendium_serpulae@DN636_c0_g1_i1.p1
MAEESAVAEQPKALQLTDPDNRGPRNIPPVIFIEDVSSFVEGHTVVTVTVELNELLAKYRLMENTILKQQSSIKLKVPDLQAAISVVDSLIDRNSKDLGEFQTNFQLCDNIYAKAAVPKTGTVLIGLGAKVMLEYPLGEAQELLKKNLESAFETLGTLESTLEYLRKQVTTCQVNIARVHNFGVSKRQTNAPQAAAAATVK